MNMLRFSADVLKFSLDIQAPLKRNGNLLQKILQIAGISVTALEQWIGNIVIKVPPFRFLLFEL